MTRFFGPGEDFEDAMLRMSQEAELIRHDGHSDYGAALERFVTEFFDAVTPELESKMLKEFERIKSGF